MYMYEPFKGILRHDVGLYVWTVVVLGAFEEATVVSGGLILEGAESPQVWMCGYTWEFP